MRIYSGVSIPHAFSFGRNFVHRMFDRSWLGMPARGCRRAAFIAVVAGGVASQSQAAPIATDLGNLSPDVQSDYATPSTSFEVTLAPTQVQWFSFNVIAAHQIILETDYYLDINTYPNTNHHVDTTIGLYDSTGNRLAVDADGGDVFYSQLSFGDVGTDRGPLTYTVDGEVFESNVARGLNGYLATGTYYLAVTRFQATFGATDFDVTSQSIEQTTDTFLLQFRGQSTAAIPEPTTVALLALGAGLVLSRLQARRRRSAQ